MLTLVVSIIDWRGGVCTDKFIRANVPSYPKDTTNGQFKNGLLIENVNVTSTKSDRTIPVNIYVPEKVTSKNLIIQIHGGGWVKRGNEKAPIHLTKQGNIVVAIFYALAPEHPFPAGINDCFDVYKWIISKEHPLLKDIDVSKIAVLGDSAGGNLSSVLSYMVRDDKTIIHKISKEVLIYPGVLFSGTTKSRNTYKNGYLLNQAKIDWFVKQYIQDEDLFRMHPYSSVLDIKNQKYLPDTLIILAKHDPLYDEGKMLHDVLKNNGVNTELREYSMIHGAYAIDFIPEGMRALNDSLNFINQ